MANNLFSENIKRVCLFAREESARMGHEHIGTEHLLLGTIKNEQRNAVRVLANLSLYLEILKQSIENHVPPSTTDMRFADIPFSHRAKKMLEKAAEEARAMEDPLIDVDHLLLALLKTEDSNAASILSTFGVTYEKAKEQMEQL